MDGCLTLTTLAVLESGFTVSGAFGFLYAQNAPACEEGPICFGGIRETISALVYSQDQRLLIAGTDQGTLIIAKLHDLLNPVVVPNQINGVVIDIAILSTALVVSSRNAHTDLVSISIVSQEEDVWIVSSTMTCPVT
jgi:hypothetical protein